MSWNPAKRSERGDGRHSPPWSSHPKDSLRIPIIFWMKNRIKPILFSCRDLKLNPFLYLITPSIHSWRCSFLSPARRPPAGNPEQPFGEGSLERLFDSRLPDHLKHPKGTLAGNANLPWFLSSYLDINLIGQVFWFSLDFSKDDHPLLLFL